MAASVIRQYKTLLLINKQLFHGFLNKYTFFNQQCADLPKNENLKLYF